MAMRSFLAFLLFPLSVWAQSSTAERALILNEEMDYLLKAAPKVQVWSEPEANAAPDFRRRRNGVAPSQMPGVENTEERYFSDEVTLKAAASDRINEEPEEGSEYDEEARDDGYRVDGTVPRN